MNTRPNILTDFNPSVMYPTISKFAYVDPLAVIIGDCEIGKLVRLHRLQYVEVTKERQFILETIQICKMVSYCML